MANNIITSVPDLEVSDDAVDSILDSLIEIVETRENIRGDARDQLTTWGELEDMGIANISSSGNISVSEGIQNGSGIGGGGGSGGGGTAQPSDPCEDDYSTPPGITGLQVSGGFTNILLTWDNPLKEYGCHSHVEIWRVSPTSGDCSNPDMDCNQSDATLADTTTTNVWTDSQNTSTCKCYWVRNVSVAGVKGPYSEAVCGCTATDPEDVSEYLNGKIQESALYKTLNRRIDLIDGPEVMHGSVNARLGGLEATLSESVGDVEALVYDTWQLDIDEDSAIITRFNDVEVSVDTTSGRIDDILNLELSPDSALAERLESLQVSNETTDNSAAVSDLITASISEDDSAFASAVRQVSISVGGSDYAVEQAMDTVYGDSGVTSQYTIKIDHDGYVAGYGLSVEPNDEGGMTSRFIVNADYFAVGNPDLTEGSKYPFIGGWFNEDGEEVDQNTSGAIYAIYLDTTFISNATITSAQIQDLTVDKLTAPGEGENATTITEAIIGTGEITNAMIGNYIQSMNYEASVDGSPGWHISKDGWMYLGSWSGSNTSLWVNGGIESWNYSSGNSGWYIDGSDGSVEFNNGTFRGRIEADSGYMDGDLISKGTITAEKMVAGGLIHSESIEDTGYFYMDLDGFVMIFADLYTQAMFASKIVKIDGTIILELVAHAYEADSDSVFGMDTMELSKGSHSYEIMSGDSYYGDGQGGHAKLLKVFAS